MIKVYQRIFKEGHGDCHTAAIASILDLPYESVPTWNADSCDSALSWDNAWNECALWLRARGLHALTVCFDNIYDFRTLYGAECLFTMPSQRLPKVRHSVVGSWEKIERGGIAPVILHDPNPNNAPYENREPISVTFLVPLRPGIITAHIGKATA